MDRMTSKPGTCPWPDKLDAVVAAPGSHRVVFENERTRVLEVMIGDWPARANAYTPLAERHAGRPAGSHPLLRRKQACLHLA
jgi:hypothetical protein